MTKNQEIKDSVFGILTFDSSLDIYCTRMKIMDFDDVEILIRASDEDEFKSSLDTGKKFVKKQSDWKKKAFDFAVKENLDNLNENWIEDTKQKLTAEIMKKSLRISSISFDPEGDFCIYCELPILEETGHGIDINGNLSDGILDAELEG